jgi:hypothetical protein
MAASDDDDAGMLFCDVMTGPSLSGPRAKTTEPKEYWV